MLQASIYLTIALASAIAADKPRLLVLTDIGADPDDQQSLVRLLLYSNELEIEGLIASAAGIPCELKKDMVRPDLIREIVEAYGKVQPNLLLHHPRPRPQTAFRSAQPRRSHCWPEARSTSPRRRCRAVLDDEEDVVPTWCLESSTGVAQQHRDVLRVKVGHC